MCSTPMTCWVMRSADCAIASTLRRCWGFLSSFTSDAFFLMFLRPSRDRHRKVEKRSIHSSFVPRRHVLLCRRLRSSSRPEVLLFQPWRADASDCDLSRVVAKWFQTSQTLRVRPYVSCAMGPLHVSPFRNETAHLLSLWCCQCWHRL